MALILHHPSPCHHQGTWWDEYGLTACKPESGDTGGGRVSITQSLQRQQLSTPRFLDTATDWGTAVINTIPEEDGATLVAIPGHSMTLAEADAFLQLGGASITARLDPRVGIVTALFVLWKAVEFDSVA